MRVPDVNARRIGPQRDGIGLGEGPRLLGSDFSGAGAEQDVIVFDSYTLTIGSAAHVEQ
jgi:hypothetical protein